MTSAITTTGLTKRFGARTAVDAIDLDVPERSVTGFVGPNGAGKTTTIRMLLGLVRPTAGRIEVLGTARETGLSYLRRVGALVEGPAMYPALSGRANLRVLARLGNLGDGAIDEALSLTGLRDRADEPVRSYSLGMRQRLGIAAALLPDPDLLILDEPTNGLDPAGMRDMRRMLRDLSDNGVTAFVSSHHLGELEKVCDHLVLLRHGRIEYQGPLRDLLRHQVAHLIARPEDESALRRLVELVRRHGHDAGVSDGALIVSAPTTWAGPLNRLAAAHDITLTELRATTASLEETFMAVAAERVVD